MATNNNDNFARWYIQHSKKLSIWGAAQWCFISLFLLFLVIFLLFKQVQLDKYFTDLLMSLVSWSATLGGVTIATYMGNSAVDHYAKNKFNAQFKVQQTENKEDDEPSQG